MLEQHSFGYWLRLKRKALDLTRDGLADRVGCSAAAIRKFEAEERRPSAQIVERLAEIFNIDPSERPAFLRFARGDWRSAPTIGREDAPWRAVDVLPRSNLPASTTSLIGREQEIAVVCEYLSNADIRLVTLIGPPGIGKTRLSIEAARASLSDFPDGVFFVALAALTDLVLVAPTIIQTLGFAETERKPPIERLKDGIGDKQMLLVLDNLEHIIEGAAPLVSELLMTCPRLKILTTSREALRVSGEWLYSVPPLNVPKEIIFIDTETVSQFSALTLFVERARAVRPDFALNADNIQAVATICSQLDGLPLAIELIAARIRLMSPESLLARLNDQFTLYADGMRAQPTRQKTLHDAIAWSYNLLSTEEQKLFACLSVFSGGFTLEAAESIFSRTTTGKSISDLIASLLDKSLLQRAYDTQGEPRFDMLVTIRQYAREKLWAAGEGEMMRQKHLAYFVDLAERAEPNLRAFDMIMWLDHLEAEHDNIRAALEWAQESDVEAHLRMASALLWFWHIRGRRNEGIDWLEQGLSIEAMERGNRPITPSRAMIRGKALNASGTMMNESRIGKAAERFEESLDLFKELSPAGKQGIAYALEGLAGWTDAITRKAMREQSLTLFREVGDKFGAAQCLMGLSADARLKGDFEKAMAIGKEQVALRKEIGDKDGIAIAQMHLGNTVLRHGDYQQARELYEESLAGFREVGNKWGIGMVLSWLSIAIQEQGNHEQATRILEEALALGQGLGDKRLIADRFDDLGKLAWAQGDYELAVKRFEEELKISREAGNKIGTAFALQGLARVAQSRKDYATALSFYSEAIVLGQEKEIGNSWIVAFHLAAFATLAAAQKRPERAARLVGAAETLIPSIRLEMSPAERAEYDQAISAARAALGEEAFAAAWTEGHAMTMEQAVAYALEDSGS